jgi:predicted Zn-dependent peptidase
MIEKDQEWQETKDCLSRFMLRGNFSNEQMLHVMGVLIDYYEKNYQHIQDCLKKFDKVQEEDKMIRKILLENPSHVNMEDPNNLHYQK